MDYMEQKSCSICIFPEKTIIYSLFFFPSKNPMYAFYRFQFYCILLSIRNLVKKNTELSKKKKLQKYREINIFWYYYQIPIIHFLLYRKQTIIAPNNHFHPCKISDSSSPSYSLSLTLFFIYTYIHSHTHT